MSIAEIAHFLGLAAPAAPSRSAMPPARRATASPRAEKVTPSSRARSLLRSISFDHLVGAPATQSPSRRQAEEKRSREIATSWDRAMTATLKPLGLPGPGEPRAGADAVVDRFVAEMNRPRSR